MNKGWVIIWVSTFCKAEGVTSGVYSDENTAYNDKDKYNLQDSTRRFHVVEFMGKEHKNALQKRSAPI